MSNPPSPSASLGLLVLRVGFGAYMAAHGWSKVQMILGEDPIQFPDPLGMGTELSLYFAAAAEFGGGILVALGLLTRFSALSAAFTMGVAAFMIHGADPWMAQGKAKEPALHFMVAFLCLVFTGPGKFALDHVIAGKWKARKGG